jgi:dynein heavy chain
VYNDQLLIEIVDTLRIKYFVNLFINEGIPTLSVGEAGIGKTLLMRNILRSLDESNYSFNIVNLTPGTNSLRL